MFEATTGVTTRVVIFRGNRFTREQRLPNELRDFGFSKGLLQPKLEVAFLLAELLDQGDLDQMGVRRIMVMHRPLFVPGYPWNLVPSLLTIGAYEHEIVWLDARLTILNGPLSEDDGFAYVVPPDRAYV